MKGKTPEKDQAKYMAQLEEIAEAVSQINEGTFEPVNQTNLEIDRKTQIRRDSLNEYRNCEKDATERLYKGMMYEIENDHQEYIQRTQKSLRELIQFKYKQIVNECPEAVELFMKNEQYPNTFVNTLNKEMKNDPLIEVTIPKGEGFYSQEKVDEKAQDIKSSTNHYSIVDGVLFKDEDKFSISTNAYLQVGHSVPQLVIIHGISQDIIEFMSNTGEVGRIGLNSFNIGLASITRA